MFKLKTNVSPECPTVYQLQLLRLWSYTTVAFQPELQQRMLHNYIYISCQTVGIVVMYSDIANQITP